MNRITEEKELVKQFLNGNDNAFKEIAKRYSKRIYWQAFGILNDHFDADEVTQSVLLVIYQKLENFKFDSSLYTWIYKITKNRSLNILAKRKVRTLFSIDSDETKHLHSGENIILNFEVSEKLERVKRVLKMLPTKQREVFIMRTFEELTYEEISEITGKSVGGLKANYFHALKKITEKFYEE